MGTAPVPQEGRILDVSRVPGWARIAASVVFLHWFVHFGVCIYFGGGDSIGVRPSEDGFVTRYHGATTQVTEGVWVFILFYSTLTLLVTPGLLIVLGWKYRVMQGAPRWLRWAVAVFVCVWSLCWFGSISREFFVSLCDWACSAPAVARPAPG